MEDKQANNLYALALAQEKHARNLQRFALTLLDNEKRMQARAQSIWDEYLDSGYVNTPALKRLFQDLGAAL